MAKRRKEQCPAGYKTARKRVTITRVYRDGSYNICFDLSKAKVYDNYLRDYLGSVCFSEDPMKAINALLRQGYSESQIKKVFDSMSRDPYRPTTLPKPIKYTVTACKTRW